MNSPNQWCAFLGGVTSVVMTFIGVPWPVTLVIGIVVALPLGGTTSINDEGAV